MISWAVAWTSAKIVNEYMSTYNLIVFRFFLGSISILPLIKFNDLKRVFNKSNIRYVLLTSILFFIYNIFFFKGTKYGLAGKGAVLVTTLNPLVTVLIMMVILRKTSKKEILGISLGLIGGLLILDIHSAGLLNIVKVGNIYFLICAVIWGLMTVLMKYAQEKIDSIVFYYACYFRTSLIALSFMEFDPILIKSLDLRFYLNFLIVSVGAMSFGTSIYIYSTPILGPVKASVFIFSVPFIALLTASVFIDEPITVTTIFGGLLSIVGIYIINFIK